MEYFIAYLVQMYVCIMVLKQKSVCDTKGSNLQHVLNNI